MSPPSTLAILTSSVQRLVKEEASYHKELEAQERRLQKLKSEENDDENREWNLKQEHLAIKETQAVFPALKQKIDTALQKLENQLEVDEIRDSNKEELEKAKEVIQSARNILAV